VFRRACKFEAIFFFRAAEATSLFFLLLLLSLCLVLFQFLRVLLVLTA
jgi:hypothetical protein